MYKKSLFAQHHALIYPNEKLDSKRKLESIGIENVLFLVQWSLSCGVSRP